MQTPFIGKDVPESLTHISFSFIEMLSKSITVTVKKIFENPLQVGYGEFKSVSLLKNRR